MYKKEAKKNILVIDVDKSKYRDLLTEDIFDMTFETNPLYGFSLAISGLFDLVIVGYFLGVDKINGVSLVNLIKIRSTVPCVVYSDQANALNYMIKDFRNRPEAILDRTKPIYPECLDYLEV